MSVTHLGIGTGHVDAYHAQDLSETTRWAGPGKKPVPAAASPPSRTNPNAIVTAATLGVLSLLIADRLRERRAGESSKVATRKAVTAKAAAARERAYQTRNRLPDS